MTKNSRETKKRKSNAVELSDGTTALPPKVAIVSPSVEAKLKKIECGFCLKCPTDFVLFYQFCLTLDAEDPLGALHSTTGLRLVGPFEILHYDVPDSVEPGQFSNMYRFFHDPPELVTLIIGTPNLHYGYFRDSANEVPKVICGFDPPDSGVLQPYASNVFELFRSVLEKSTDDIILKKLQEFVSDHSIKATQSITDIRKWRSNCVTPTLNHMGLFVNLRDGDVGYRSLSVSYSKLTSLLQAVVTASDNNQLTKLEAIDELVTYAQFACDEGDYGQSLDLGLSMLAFKPKGVPVEKCAVFNSRILHLLSVGYQLAGRHEFSQVIRNHMKNRQLNPVPFHLGKSAN